MFISKQKLIWTIEKLIDACDKYAEKHPEIQESNPQDEDWNNACNEAKELLAIINKSK